MTLLELRGTERLQDLEIELEWILVGVIEEAWNLYNPSSWLAKPLISRDVESCMLHWLDMNCKVQDREWYNLATYMRFNLKEGE